MLISATFGSISGTKIETTYVSVIQHGCKKRIKGIKNVVWSWTNLAHSKGNTMVNMERSTLNEIWDYNAHQSGVTLHHELGGLCIYGYITPNFFQYFQLEFSLCPTNVCMHMWQRKDYENTDIIKAWGWNNYKITKQVTKAT